MNTVKAFGVLVLFAATLAAQVRESERILDLQDLQPLFAQARDKSLFLGVTNQPPELLRLMRPTPLKKRGTSRGERKIHVHLGRDLIGFAEISEASRGPLPTTSTNAPKIHLMSVFLTFETAEQAAKAAEALRLPGVQPQPLKLKMSGK